MVALAMLDDAMRKKESEVKERRTWVFSETETSRGFRLPIGKDAGCAL
jgi:hypothetical protein